MFDFFQICPHHYVNESPMYNNITIVLGQGGMLVSLDSRPLFSFPAAWNRGYMSIWSGNERNSTIR